MLVKKRVEMWNAVRSEEKPDVWILTDCNGNKSEVSDEEFYAVYEEVPERHESRRQKGSLQKALEATE